MNIGRILSVFIAWIPFVGFALIAMFFNVGVAEAGEPVLLLGNSFSAQIHQQIPQKGLIGIRAVGGWNLDQHLNSGISNASLCNNRKFVLLQDFSTRPNDSALFQNDIDKAVAKAFECKTTPLLFMTWETISISYGVASNAYNSAANKHGLQVVPIGTVFHEIRQQSEFFYQSLIEPDGKHPSYRGEKVGAACILKTFCPPCYQGFDWSGFSNNEINFIKQLINTHVPVAKEIDFTKQPMVIAPILELLLD